MKPIFTLDVGSGTQDFLLFAEENLRNCPKMILPSPTRIIASRISSIEGDVYLYGYTMGGGAITKAVKEHLKKYRVYADEKAALTFADDLGRVREMGIIIGEKADSAVGIKTGDVDMGFFSKVLSYIGYGMPEVYLIAVQDHGYSPKESNRVFRFKMFRRLLNRSPYLDSFLFKASDVPEEFNRMRDAVRCVVDGIANFQPEVYVSDTVFAAMAGCAGNAEKFPALLINFGNSHVTAAIVSEDWEVKAIMEHHTSVLKRRGEEYVREIISRFTAGNLTNEDVLEDGGHGCYYREVVDVKDVVSTGPNVHLSYWREVQGDAMIVGNIGLLGMLKKRCSSE